VSTVAIAAVGSRGDVVPLAGVGSALQQAGHRVVIAAYAPFADLITGRGLEFRELPADFTPGTDHAEATSKETIAAIFTPRGQRETGQLILDTLGNLSADILLVSPLSELAAHPLAEAHGIPSLGMRLQPLSSTGAYPPSLLGAWSLGARGNRLAGDAAVWAVDRLYGGVVAGFRRDLGLPKIPARALRRRRRGANWTILHGYSPSVLGRPADWRPGLEVTGYWWPPSPTDWQPPAALTDFLAAGSPPVFIGLGSTVVSAWRAEQLGTIFAAALQRAGARGVIQSGWAGLDVTGDDVLTIGEAPHDWLLPRMAAAAHHCGAGTTAAGLRAGIPTIALPGPAGDQPFWARRLHQLGAGAAAIPQRALTVDNLAEAIRSAVGNGQFRDSAARLAQQIAYEDGTAHAVAAVQDLLNAHHGR
jgi:sterol 3beta-glucosyltransferase